MGVGRVLVCEHRTSGLLTALPVRWLRRLYTMSGVFRHGIQPGCSWLSLANREALRRRLVKPCNGDRASMEEARHRMGEQVPGFSELSEETLVLRGTQPTLYRMVHATTADGSFSASPNQCSSSPDHDFPHPEY
jgi:hypothetical protein